MEAEWPAEQESVNCKMISSAESSMDVYVSLEIAE